MKVFICILENYGVSPSAVNRPGDATLCLIRENDHPRLGGVQSLPRALDLVEVVAAKGGELTIGEISTSTGIPLPTPHRLLRTLVDRGYMRQMPNRRYALGFRLVPLGATRALWWASTPRATWATCSRSGG